MKPAVFLDRDGVLASEKGYVCRAEDLAMFPYARECIQTIREKNYYAIVLTNQSGIARGLFSEAELRKMNQRLIQELGVDAVYYCPHHPSGKISGYCKTCSCRKPETGMVQQACKEFSIDLSRSYMVGDRASDILLGQRAGMTTVLLESGYGTAGLEEAVQPDYVCDDLEAFVQAIIK